MEKPQDTAREGASVDEAVAPPSTVCADPQAARTRARAEIVTR